MSANENTIPAEEIAGAVANTVLNPSVSNILNDVELAVKIVADLKTQLNGKHPGLWQVIQLLFNLHNAQGN